MTYSYDFPHPAVTADACVFRRRGGTPEILLVRRGSAPFAGCWALPGGFVGIDEELEAAAARELAEETGVEGLQLEQFHAFGTVGRDPRERVISVAYLAVAGDDEIDPARLRGGDDAEDARWFAIDDLPALAFDHDAIVARAADAAGFGRGRPDG